MLSYNSYRNWGETANDVPTLGGLPPTVSARSLPSWEMPATLTQLFLFSLEFMHNGIDV